MNSGHVHFIQSAKTLFISSLGYIRANQLMLLRMSLLNVFILFQTVKWKLQKLFISLLLVAECYLLPDFPREARCLRGMCQELNADTIDKCVSFGITMQRVTNPLWESALVYLLFCFMFISIKDRWYCNLKLSNFFIIFCLISSINLYNVVSVFNHLNGIFLFCWTWVSLPCVISWIKQFNPTWWSVLLNTDLDSSLSQYGIEDVELFLYSYIWNRN